MQHTSENGLTSLRNHVLVVDDERTTLAVVQRTLEQDGFVVSSFESPLQALDAFRQGGFDIILSDFHMPEMNGDEFLQRIREISSDCPFLFLTVDTNLKQAIEMIQRGADDYIVKPIVHDDLVFRVHRCIEAIHRRQKEENWRQLYASKDIRQTEKMIDQLSLAVNQTGGYLWLDLLKGELQNPAEGKYQLSSEIGDMVLETAELQKQILEYITMIAETNRIELHPQVYTVETLVQEVEAYCRERIEDGLASYGRALSVGKPIRMTTGEVRVDLSHFHKVLNELLVNAVKFSPEGSRIIFSMDVPNDHIRPRLELTIQNQALLSSLTGENGKQVMGIPQEYGEMVFDLFFSSDPFSAQLPGEEWPNGAGLYICRKIMKRHGGWIRVGSGTDHTGDRPVPVVRMTMSLPLSR